MTRKSLIMLIDDDPVSEAKMALAKEHHDRTSAFGRLCNEGHVKVVEDNDPINIRCRIEDEFFAEERSRFPSTLLMAKLQLAIAAGRSCRNDPKDETETAQHQLDAYRYAYGGRAMGNSAPLGVRYGKSSHMSWMSAPVSEAVATGYNNVAAITKKFTATVKRPKGIRP